jgi:hypothetical protein
VQETLSILEHPGGFVGGPITKDPAQLGLVAVDLAASFPQWIRRRKTTYEFIDEGRVTLRRSIDFVLPGRAWFDRHEAPRVGQTIYIPLDIFKKETLSGFSVFDGRGDPVSVLNTHENGTLVAEGFSALAAGRIEGATRAEFLDHLRGIVEARTLEQGETAYKEAMEGPLGDALADGAHAALLKELRGGFLMLVPVEYQPGENHIFKLLWSTRFTWRNPGIAGGLRSAAASLGLLDKEIVIDDELSIGFAYSTHFELRPPEGVRNLETTLSRVQPHDDEGASYELVAERIVYNNPQATVNASIRDPEDVVASRADLGALTIRLRPRLGGTFLAIVVLATLTAALMWVIAARLGELDAQSTSAVVLLLPVALSAYLSREGEHAIGTRLRGGVRLGGLVVSGLAFASATLIAVGDLHAPVSERRATTTCTATNGVPPRSGNATPPLARLDCDSVAPGPSKAAADEGLRTTLVWLASVASGVAVLLVAGFVSSLRATRRAMGETDWRSAGPS